MRELDRGVRKQGGFGRRMGLDESEAQARFAEFINVREEKVMRLKERFEKNSDLMLDKGKLDEMFNDNHKKASNLVLFLEATEKDAFTQPILLENMKRYDGLKDAQKRMRESRLQEADVQLTSGFLGITPQDIVKVARIGYPNSVAPDIFDFWGMTSMKDSIYKLETLYGSTNRGATASGVIYETYNDGRYPSEFERQNVTASATTTFSGTLSQAPIRPYHAYVYLDNVQVGTDDGAGHFVGSALNSSATNTINYNTGAFYLTFTSTLSSASDIEIEYAYDSEQQSLFGNVGSVLLDLVTYDYRAIPFPLYIEWTRFTEELMESKLGLSAKDQLIAGAGDVFRKSMDEFTIAKGISATNWTTAETFDTDYTTAGDDSSIEHAQSVLQAIINAEYKTYNQLGRLADKTSLLCEYKAYSYLTKHRLFNSVAPASKIGVFKVGTLEGRDVYVLPPSLAIVNQPAASANTAMIYCMGKGNDQMNVDSVVSVGTWKASVTTNPVELKNFNSQMGLMFMGDVRKNNVYFATKVQLTNITSNS
jgi:hypothetical protein